ncbi:hypothetical protein H0H92_011297 [Tricholoma furcatifolium]|nr:hypothetical protein H0H92_011297 [Tricholoma furcatifolium]
MSSQCPSDNTIAVDQSSFWSSSGVNWDAHRVGWAIAGGCSVVLTKLLLIEYVAATTTEHKAESVIANKDKRSMPIPITFRQLANELVKAYFMYTVKVKVTFCGARFCYVDTRHFPQWSVLQYVIFRPLISIVGIICEKYNVLCESAGFNPSYANLYLEVVDFLSITIALYGLLVFYGLMSDELKGRRPLAKFLCIKLIVMFTFYQSFVFSALEGRVIKATTYWTATNIADGLSALTICIEMVIFSALMMWAYPATEYRQKTGSSATSIWRPLWDSINYSDFAHEIYGSLHFFFTKKRLPSAPGAKMDFGEAFGLTGRGRVATGDDVARIPSYDERIHLAAVQSYPLQETYGQPAGASAMQERYAYGQDRSS